ncbi:hypothetical protein KSS87_022614, partial [Heliosperma pusillum]
VLFFSLFYISPFPPLLLFLQAPFLAIQNHQSLFLKMSFSDSEGSARGRPNEHKNFRMVGRDRLLYEMLKSTSADSKAWK